MAFPDLQNVILNCSFLLSCLVYIVMQAQDTQTGKASCLSKSEEWVFLTRRDFQDSPACPQGCGEIYRKSTWKDPCAYPFGNKQWKCSPSFRVLWTRLTVWVGCFSAKTVIILVGPLSFDLQELLNRGAILYLHGQRNKLSWFGVNCGTPKASVTLVTLDMVWCEGSGKSSPQVLLKTWWKLARHGASCQ